MPELLQAGEVQGRTFAGSVGRAHAASGWWRARLALLIAGALAGAGCLSAPAARASTGPVYLTGPCDYDAARTYTPNWETRWGGTLVADSAGALYSPAKIATARGSGWDSSLLSYDWNYLLVMQDDGNLVLHRVADVHTEFCGGEAPGHGDWMYYRDLGVAWASGPTYWGGETGPTVAALQADGNLVVYESQAGAIPIWASNSSGSPVTSQYRLVVQDDGNLVIYLGAQVIWDRYAGSHR
jgi:hypothetical protein